MKFELRKWNLEDSQDVAYYANNKKIAANLRNVFPYPYILADAEGYIRTISNLSNASWQSRFTASVIIPLPQNSSASQ